MHQCSLAIDQILIPSAFKYSLYHQRFASFYLILGVSLIIVLKENDQNSSFYAFNRFMPNGMPHHYQLDESISNIGLLGSKFQFHSFLKVHSASKQCKT